MFGVYVHFPYCKKRCPYCDFAIHVRRRIPHVAYADAVCAELEARAPLFGGRGLVSIYFGGGTPSLWEPAEVARVIASVRARFSVAAPLEITLEANPDDLPLEQLGALRVAGVNRLSIGAQSFDTEALVRLGRLHGASETRRAVGLARQSGYDNLSLDLMYGLPGQTPRALAEDVDALLAEAPEHLSCYQLTVEPYTPFAAYRARGELPVVDPELAADLYELVEARARAAGFVHYEVSSYARPGRQSTHNSLYWRGGEWLGLGSAAHSYRHLPGRAGAGGERWATVKNVDEYMRRAGQMRPGVVPASQSALIGGPVAAHEPIDEDALAREAAWLGLRLLDEGLDRDRFTERFGSDPLARFAAVLGPLVEGGLVLEVDRGLLLSPRGALLADEIAARLL